MRALQRLTTLLRERDEEFTLIGFELVRFCESDRQRAERLSASVEWEKSGGVLRREFPDRGSISRVPLFRRCQKDWLAAQRLAHWIRRVGWYFLQGGERLAGIADGPCRAQGPVPRKKHDDARLRSHRDDRLLDNNVQHLLLGEGPGHRRGERL